MQKRTFLHRLLVGCALCAMLYLFFHQARVAMKPIPVAFEGTPIAYGYNISTFTGTVYHDEGITAIGAGTGVTMHINGSATAPVITANTNSSGLYSFSDLTLTAGDILTVYVDDGIIDGTLVARIDSTLISAGSISGMDIYKDRLIIRSESANQNVITTDLALADDAGDGDVTRMYTISGNDLHLGHGKELYIYGDSTHTTSGAIYTHDLEVRGTLKMANSANITASGSFIAAGTVDSTGDITLTSVASGESLQVISSGLHNLYIDNGLLGYFRFDEGTGTNASGSMLNTGSGGSLLNGASFVQTNTGTTLFYNPYAIEFDGTNDKVDFGNTYNVSQSIKRTFAAWFRRKSATTEDVIFAKKVGSGASFAGHMLYIDDESDKLLFEVADGTNRYVVTSKSTVTDQNWHHVAVSYDPLDTDRINIFLDGAIDVSNKTTGGLESSGKITGTFTNTHPFIVGQTQAESGSFIGTIDDVRIYSRTMSGDEISVLGTGLRAKSTGSGTYYLNANLNVNEDLGIFAGTLDIGTGYTINVENDLKVPGILRTNSGTVTLDGTGQTILGSTAFNQLAKTVTETAILTFESFAEQTVSGAITLQGASNNQLDLRASVAGNDTYLIVESANNTILKHLDVKDNNAFSGALMSCSIGCVDGGNNTNWEFLGVCQDGVVNTGEECDDGNSNNFDSCPNDCKNAVCGDSVKEGTEECEPPNAGSCLSNCQLRGAGGGGGGGRGSRSNDDDEEVTYYNRPAPPDGCGNGLVDEDGEECDNGLRFNGLGTCSYDCKSLHCGDGTVSPHIGEDCEPTSLGEKDGVQQFEVATCGEVCTAPEFSDTGTRVGGCRKMYLPSCDSKGSDPNTDDEDDDNDEDDPVTAVCGNGTVESPEECDFGGICEGGQFNGSFWTDLSSAQTCVSGGGEPKATSGDGCSDACVTEFCGDGVRQERGADNQLGTADDEDCDNGSVCSNDSEQSCRLDSDCTGDGTCEYTASVDRTCSSSCKRSGGGASPIGDKPAPPASPVCGNGKEESGEQCDEGARNGATGASCTKDCKEVLQSTAVQEKEKATCGNGVREGEEECDNGTGNSDTQPSACRTNCRNSSCGDFVVDLREQCDSGSGNSNFIPDRCRENCTLPVCGDGVVDSGEQCDGGLSCQPGCRLALSRSRCGNGRVEVGEQCDDGNNTPGDGCSRFCQREKTKPAPLAKKEKKPEKEKKVENKEQTAEKRELAALPAKLDADVVIVNPIEFAIALKFLDVEHACCQVVAKGRNMAAKQIRSMALAENIPIVRNVPLARGLYREFDKEREVKGEHCKKINKIKKTQRVLKEKATEKNVPEKIDAALEEDEQKLEVAEPVLPEVDMPVPVMPEPPPLPMPTPLAGIPPLASGHLPYAQISPLALSRPPAGDTGPGLLSVIVAGAAAGMGWRKRKKRRG